MKYLGLLILSLLLVTNLSYGQEKGIVKKSPTVYKNAIGGVAGFTIGTGLAYKRIFEKYSVQVSFAPYKEEDREEYRAAISFYYNIVKTPKINFYLYQGNHYVYKEYTDYSWNYKMDIIEEKKSIESYWNNGLGVGIQLLVFGRVGLNWMAGYASYDNYKRISFTGETGVLFMF